MGCYQTLIPYISNGNCNSELIFGMRVSFGILYKNMTSYPIISEILFLWRHHFRTLLQNVSSKTEKPQRLLRQSHFAVQISSLQSFQTSLSFKIARLRRSVGQSECHGVSWVSSWLCLVVPVQTIRQMWIAWQTAACKVSKVGEDGGEWNCLLVQVTWFALSA